MFMWHGYHSFITLVADLYILEGGHLWLQGGGKRAPT